MAKKIVRTLPLWGLSALAVGAPLPHPVDNDAPSSAVSRIVGVTQKPEPKSLPALHKAALRAVRRNREIIVPGSGTGAFERNRPMDIAETLPDVFKDASADAASVSIAISAISAATRTSLGSDTARLAPAVLMPVIAADQKPIAVAQKAISARQMLPGNIADGRISAGMELAAPSLESAKIYGTSAQNAYKVYYPQIEQSAPGKSGKNVSALSASPDMDARVVVQKGSYLFYEAPADETSPALAESSKPKGTPRASDSLSNKEEGMLTAPVLQKFPLDLGVKAVQPSSQTAMARELPAQEPASEARKKREE